MGQILLAQFWILLQFSRQKFERNYLGKKIILATFFRRNFYFFSRKNIGDLLKSFKFLWRNSGFVAIFFLVQFWNFFKFFCQNFASLSNFFWWNFERFSKNFGEVLNFFSIFLAKFWNFFKFTGRNRGMCPNFPGKIFRVFQFFFGKILKFFWIFLGDFFFGNLFHFFGKILKFAPVFFWRSFGAFPDFLAKFGDFFGSVGGVSEDPEVIAAWRRPPPLCVPRRALPYASPPSLHVSLPCLIIIWRQ